MKARKLRSEEKLVADAVDLLVDRLGPVEASRFLSLPREERLESVQRHQQWQSALDKDEFFDQVFAE